MSLTVLILYALVNQFQFNSLNKIELSNSQDSQLLFSGIEHAKNEDPFSDEHFIKLTNTSSDTLKGYVHFGAKYMTGSFKWVVGEYAKTADRVNHFFLRIPPSDSTLLEITLSELDVTNPAGFKLFFSKESVFRSDQRFVNLSQSFFLGIFLFLTLFNLILYLVTKWMVYLKYAAYIFSVVLYLCYYFGFWFDLFPHMYPSVSEVSIAYGLIFALYFIFVLDLGNYKESSPRAAYFLRVGIIYQLIQVPFELLMHSLGYDFILSDFYKYAFLVFELLLILLIVYYIIRTRDFRGRIVIIGSSFLIVAAVLVQFDLPVERAYVLETGVLAELMAFSVGLGYITRRLFEENKKNQELYIEELKKNEKYKEETAKKLERLVERRTSELQQEKRLVEKKNAENEALVHEIHHRVKNNLQMISSILGMQSRRISDSIASEILSNTKSRISSIGAIHEYLYSHGSLEKINLEDYIRQLFKIIFETINSDKEVNPEFLVEDIDLTIDSVLQIGLITTELLTNSIKHAKRDGFLKITFILKKDKEKILLTLKDNGKANDTDVTYGFGYTLISTLIGGSDHITTHQDQEGFVSTIEIPINQSGV
mgnify:CR=1 FL=1